MSHYCGVNLCLFIFQCLCYIQYIYMFRIIISSWWIVTLINMKWPSLPVMIKGASFVWYWNSDSGLMSCSICLKPLALFHSKSTAVFDGEVNFSEATNTWPWFLVQSVHLSLLIREFSLLVVRVYTGFFFVILLTSLVFCVFLFLLLGYCFSIIYSPL